MQAALKAARDGLVSSELQQVVQSLLDARTKTAVERQSRVVEQLQRVLGLLQAQELSWEDLQKQLANLQELRDKLQKLIERQEKLEKQSGKAMKDAAQGKKPDAQALEKQKTDQAATRGDTEKTAGETKDKNKFPPDTVDPSALPRAATQMQQAEQSLGEQKPAEANTHQRQALDELQAAVGQVKQKLDMEKARQQAKMLAELQDGLKAMLAKQQTATAATAGLDKQLDPKSAPPRELTLKAASLAADEAALAKQSDDFVKKLQDDGTSAVFGKVLEQSATTLRDVESRLQKTQAGPTTQEQQKHVEANFQELMEALEQEQERRAAAGGGMGGGGGGMMQTMLLPPAAELKMLRMLQDRVNRGTRSLDEDRASHVEKPTPEETAAAQKLSQREGEVAQAAESLRKKWNEQSAPPPGALPANPLEADPLKQFMTKLQQEEKNPLTPIGKNMGTVRESLAKIETGGETRRLQSKIIRDLNDLIAAAQQAQSQAQAIAVPQPRRAQQPGKLPEAGQQPRGTKQPSSPAGVSALPQGGATPPGKLNKIYGGGDSDAWGKLPPAEREKFLQTLKEKFPERYQEILTEYFKQLSTSTPPVTK